MKLVRCTFLVALMIQSLCLTAQWKKFTPRVTFSEFLTPVYHGKLAPVNCKGNVTARRFRSAIGYTYKNEGINFGGHYCFVQWGCGSPCQQSAIVDVRNGNVYDGPVASLGYDYKIDSRMVIVNPPDDTTGAFSKNGGYFDTDCPYCTPEIWIWDEHAKMFKEYNWEKK